MEGFVAEGNGKKPMKQVDNSGHPFDAYYFAHGCGRPYQRDEEWLKFFGSIAERIVSDIQPHTVLDTGCAMGFLVEALRDRGVEAYGVDISEYAIQNVIPDLQPYCWVGSVIEAFPRSYDLIVCIEVLEHLKPREAEKALENICRHTDDVLFSSTPFDYKEATHFNVQPPEHWAELFARQGFLRDVDYDASFITPWAARFRCKQEVLPRIVRDYERRFWLLWKENTDLRSLTTGMRDQLAQQEIEIKDLKQAVSASDEQLGAIVNSRTWRFIHKFRRLFHL
jgi:SAM-dependent methyltransferase